MPFQLLEKSGAPERTISRRGRLLKNRTSWNGTSGGFAFPRAVRLLRRAEFLAVYQGNRRRAGKQFAVFFLPNGRHLTRFGISVKRTVGGAVVRNRIRRRIREIVRLHRQEIAPGWDIVIHPRSSVATAPFRPLAEELIELLRSAVGPAPTKS